MTKPVIIRSMKAAGLKYHSKSMDDYSRAKRIIFGDRYFNPGEYDRMIKIITDYLWI